MSTTTSHGSILNTVKNTIGIDVQNVDFDSTLVDTINSVLMFMTQMGIGPDTGFSISSAKEKWEDFLQDILLINIAKMYVPFKVKEMFDPPSSNVLGQALSKRIEELEIRMKTQSDYIKSKT